MNWRKSTYSSGNGGECVEVANTDHVLVRDSKDTDGPRLTFGRQAWEMFAAKVKAELDPESKPRVLAHACRGVLLCPGLPFFVI